MMRADDVASPSETISSPGYDASNWLPAIVPGTVLNSLVHNGTYPEPYFGLNNKLESGKIPDISRVGRNFYTYWFRTEFEVPSSFPASRCGCIRPASITVRKCGLTVIFWLPSTACSRTPTSM